MVSGPVSARSVAFPEQTSYPDPAHSRCRAPGRIDRIEKRKFSMPERSFPDPATRVTPEGGAVDPRRAGFLGWFGKCATR
jgi:hypothetical protein